MLATTTRKQWGREELADGHILVWAQHGRHHTVYTVSPEIGIAPINCYHGTNSMDVEQSFGKTLSSDMVDN